MVTVWSWGSEWGPPCLDQTPWEWMGDDCLMRCCLPLKEWVVAKMLLIAAVNGIEGESPNAIWVWAMGFLPDDRAKALVADDLAEAAWSLPSSDELDAARWVTGHACWLWLDRTEMRSEQKGFHAASHHVAVARKGGEGRLPSPYLMKMNGDCLPLLGWCIAAWDDCCRWIWIPLVITKILAGGDRLINISSEVGRTAAMAVVLDDGGGAPYLVLQRFMERGVPAV
ncbi:hypothetical protein ACLOJK_004733 [Asimina triloba]